MRRGSRQAAFVLAGAVLVWVFLACSSELRPQEPRTVGATLTPKQQRELLRWTHRRVQRDLRRLAKLSEELQKEASKSKSELLTAKQRAEIAQLEESIGRLCDEFDKSDPFVLALDIVAQAETIHTQAQDLREYFEEVGKGTRQFSALQPLTRKIEQAAERVAKRLRNP